MKDQNRVPAPQKTPRFDPPSQFVAQPPNAARQSAL